MFKRFIISLLFALLATFLIDCSKSTHQTVYPGKEWEEVIPENQGVDPGKLSQAVTYLEDELASTGGVNSLMIIRNGYLIHKGSDAKKMHCVWSCSKSFTSTVLGLLIDEGRCSLETKACDYAPVLREKYPEVTLRHFATMTSGYDAVGGSYGEEDPDDGSRIPLHPATPAFPPGTKYSYFDDAMRMNGYVLTLIAGTDLENYFVQRIAGPIGMDLHNFKWDIYPENDKNYTWVNPKGVDVRDGAGGIYITPLDLARFGYLFLHNGKWNGNQLVSVGWIRKATKCQVPTDMDWRNDTPRQNGHGVGRYGYNWWLNTVGKDETRSFPDAPADLYLASGYNNNKCFVIPDWNMVIVRMGIEGTPDGSDAIWNEFLRLIGESLNSGSTSME